MKNNTDIPNKSQNRKYLSVAVVVSILTFTVLAFVFITQKPKSDPVSEAVIRQVAAKQLNKEPNDLADEDYLKITKFALLEKELSDIKLIEKFSNLQELHLNSIHFASEKIPKWMKLLAKLGIIDLSKRTSINLSPLKKLPKLKILIISSTRISDIEPLKNNRSLQMLTLNNTWTKDFSSLKGLSNLESLNLNNNKVSDIEFVSELTNLKTLELWRTGLTDLEPIKKVTNLQQLVIDYALVSNLEPLKELPHLLMLSIQFCGNINEDEVEDLKKALPNMVIVR